MQGAASFLYNLQVQEASEWSLKLHNRPEFRDIASMIRFLMSNGKAAKRLNALANSLRVPLRPLCSGKEMQVFVKFCFVWVNKLTAEYPV